MSTFRNGTLLALLCGALVLRLPAANAQDRELGAGGVLLEGVAAVVGEGVVLKSEVTEQVASYVQRMNAQLAQLPPEQRRPLPPISIIEQQVLEQLILREIQVQRAERIGIRVSDDMLNEALSRFAQNLGYTLEELPTVLAAEGVDYALFREESRRDLIIEQLERRDVIRNISITPRELDQCLATIDSVAANEYDYNISHILISLPSNATQDDIDAARARIEEIHDRLEAGEDFARLAIATSHAQTALEGGSLGWRKGSQLPTLFADIVMRMKPGELSEPIQSSGGFQIVKLNDVRGAERVLVNQLHVRHILVRPNEILDEDAARQKLLGIRAQILAGDDFATVAEAVSEDPGSAAEGGDLGWLSPGDVVPEFEQAIVDLPLNTLSEPIKTPFGWHLAEVLGRRSYDTTDDMKEQRCITQIRAAKAEEERQLWQRRLRDQAYVEIRG